MWRRATGYFDRVDSYALPGVPSVEVVTMEGASFSCGQSAKAYILAGNARVTLVSSKTGARFTYRVRLGKDDGAPHFVSLLNGSDNESDYCFLGTVFTGTNYVHGRKSRIGREAPSAKAFAWAWTYLAKGELPPGCEVCHEGTCGRCGRSLTVPESVAAGIGPECANKMAA